MPDTDAKPIINREAPIVVLNDSLSLKSSELSTQLRFAGLVNQVHDFRDVPKATLSKFRLIVVMTNSDTSEERGSGHLLHYAALNRPNERLPILVIDTGARQPLYTMNLPDGVDYSWSIESYGETVDLISTYFREHIPERLYRRKRKEEDKTNTLRELIERLDLAADAISDLRINSTSEVVSELRSVSQQLRLKFSDDAKGVTSKDIRTVITEALVAISKVYDHIDNSRLAAIIVSGATTALLGCSGYSAVASMTIMLASWNGRDAFIAAISKLGPPKKQAKE